ncbi:MAG TPA: hypothetical protein VM716_00785 [Gemmatimonadales bacterium]|nr:hypothetical protein [Gemmatimonadales bacterium]
MCLTTACFDWAGPTPPAPPLDIRGTYDVVWTIGQQDPDSVGSYEWQRRGECPGTITIQHQSDASFSGTVHVPAGFEPGCRPGDFRISATMYRNYGLMDAGWTMYMTTDVGSLLGCKFLAASPGNTPGPRGTGWITPEHQLSFAFGNIYDCGGTRWEIIAGAQGTLRSS